MTTTIQANFNRLARAELASDSPKIDRNGGKWGAGIIHDVSLASVGEALGHEMWLDETTIEQVVELSAESGDKGVKARFTHPSMCADGMGRYLGRLFDVRSEGGKAVGDLHFAKVAHDTPDGDLAEYVMSLTEEDSRAAGLSIVFEHDREAEGDFLAACLNDDDCFESPDPLNENNYPHVRLKELRAADIVDEPAANPDGLFDRDALPRDADALLSYAVGITDDPPEITSFDIEPERVRTFFHTWLSNHTEVTFSQTKDQEPMAKDNQGETAPQVTRESLLAEQNRYIERFGAENGVKWFTEGVEYVDALERFADAQAADVERLSGELNEANEKLAAVDLGEDPVDTPPGGKTPKTFASKIRVVGA